MAFSELTLSSISLFSVVIFSLAWGWGIILMWGLGTLEYSPVCRVRCSLDWIIGMYWIWYNGGLMFVLWNPGFSSMTLDCWDSYRKLISLELLYLYFLGFFGPWCNSYEAIFPWYFEWWWRWSVHIRLDCMDCAKRFSRVYSSKWAGCLLARGCYCILSKLEA